MAWGQEIKSIPSHANITISLRWIFFSLKSTTHVTLAQTYLTLLLWPVVFSEASGLLML